MALSMKLLVHGVPKGHQIWNGDQDDKRYLVTMYGRTDIVKMDKAMLVEVKSLGGNVYTYYTLFVSNNVSNSDGRASSYFALSIRLNAYYLDVQNMYRILYSAYDKMCIGLCVDDCQNGNVKFRIADFDNVGDKLKTIEKSVIGYISTFSNDSDIVSLSGFKANVQNKAQQINLQEATSGKVMQLVRGNGNAIVSPLFPDSRTDAILKQKDEDFARYKSDAQTRLAESENAKKQAIEEQKRNEQTEINGLKKDHQEEVKTIKARYKDVDKKLQEKDNTINEKQRQLNESNKKIKKMEQQLRVNGDDDKIMKTIKFALPYLSVVLSVFILCYSCSVSSASSDLLESFNKNAVTVDSMNAKVDSLMKSVDSLKVIYAQEQSDEVSAVDVLADTTAVDTARTDSTKTEDGFNQTQSMPEERSWWDKVWYKIKRLFR